MEDNKKHTKMLLELVNNKCEKHWRKEDTAEASGYLRYMFANNEVDKSKITNKLIVDLIEFAESSGDDVPYPDECRSFLVDFILGKQGLDLL